MADANSGLVIIASRFNDQITDALVDGARYCLDQHQLHSQVIRVSGAFDIPVACHRVIAQGASGVIALGCVIRGDTDHYDYVCRGCTDGLMRVMLDSGVPIGFGILMTDTLLQAQVRSSREQMIAAANHDQESAVSNKGYEAAQSVIETLRALPSE